MTAWNEYILAATFMSDERAYTLPVRLQQYVGDYSTEWGLFAAGSLIVSIVQWRSSLRSRSILSVA